MVLKELANAKASRIGLDNMAQVECPFSIVKSRDYIECERRGNLELRKSQRSPRCPMYAAPIKAPCSPEERRLVLGDIMTSCYAPVTGRPRSPKLTKIGWGRSPHLNGDRKL